MTFLWAQIGPSVVAAFLASLVEFIEAMTVVLAVGAMRGWRSALTGSFLACLTLAVLVALLGQTLTHVPLPLMQAVVGTLLLLFGVRWLRKAILRAAGAIPLRNEGDVYLRERQALKPVTSNAHGLDGIAVAAAFKITMLEGIEVVFIVIAVGSAGHGLLLPAAAGAFSALLVVIALGAILHRPAANIPENTLKLVVGVLLSAFGTFWVGEGIGIAWPGSDWSVLALLVGYAAATVMTMQICRASAIHATSQTVEDTR